MQFHVKNQAGDVVESFSSIDDARKFVVSSKDYSLSVHPGEGVSFKLVKATGARKKPVYSFVGN